MKYRVVRRVAVALLRRLGKNSHNSRGHARTFVDDRVDLGLVQLGAMLTQQDEEARLTQASAACREQNSRRLPSLSVRDYGLFLKRINGGDHEVLAVRSTGSQ